MERSAAQSSVTHRSLAFGNLIYTVAGRDDEADILRLLQENELGGWVRLSLERTAGSFSADFGGQSSQAFIIARDRDTGEAVGICERSVSKAYVGGEERRLPYLSSLRVARRYRNRIRVLKGGFEAVRTLLASPADLPYALTSITSGNDAARRVLCAELPGVPAYCPCGSLSTFALRPSIQRLAPNVEHATAADIPAIALLLQRVYRRYDFAPAWTIAEFRHLLASGDLQIDDILIVRHGPGVRACLALWDRSAVKQTVVRGYASSLAFVRPLLNLASPLTGMPRMPAAGQPLRQVYLSHVAVENEDSETFQTLLTAGLTCARQRDFDVALIGFSSDHPFSAVVRKRGALHYRSDLYLVSWDNAEPARADNEVRLPHPEIAIM